MKWGRPDDGAAGRLLYSAGPERARVNEPARAGAYLALFSEIGFVLLVTVLAGVLGGYWIDKQLGTVPLFVLAGFALGLAGGSMAIYRMITRFLSRLE